MTVAWDFQGSLPPELTLTATSLATIYDANGYITYRPNNLLLNSATLSTQNVATTAASPYIISFKGTGSIALSGTATATVNGTGANDRVFLKFSPTAGTLTLTVTGTVTEAQLEAVTYETSPRTYNATTGAIYYGPRFDYDPAHGQSGPLLRLEGNSNNLVANSSNLGTGTYVINNVNRSSSAVLGPDNYTAAWFITATASNGYIRCQPASSTTTNRNISLFMRRKTGTGTITVSAGTNTIDATAVPSTGWTRYNTNVAGQTSTYTADGVNITVVTTVPHNLIATDRVRFVATTGTAGSISSGDITVVNSTTFTFASAVAATSGSATIYAQTIRIDLGTSGDEVYLWGIQYQNTRGMSSYMPTNGATFSRTLDYLTCDTTNFSSWFTNSGSVICEFVLGFPADTNNSNNPVYSIGDGTVNPTSYTYGASGSITVVAGTTGSFSYTGTFGPPGLRTVGQSLNYSTAANIWKLSGQSAQTFTSTGLVVSNRLHFGQSQALNAATSVWLKSFKFYNRPLTQAELEALVP